MSAAEPRPLWITAMAALCAFSAAFLIYRDLTIPEVRDTEVWLGFELRGRVALLTAPLHWGIFAVGAWAYFTQQRWAALATAIYLHYVAVSHLVWSEASERGNGWAVGLLQAAAFSALAIPFWWKHRSRPAR
jgi:hypothetical protein